MSDRPAVDLSLLDGDDPLHPGMREPQARDLMRHGVVVCNYETPLPEVARILGDHGLRAVVVADLDGERLGVCSGWDLLGAWGPDFAATMAGQVMSPDAVVVRPETPVREVAGVMRARRIHRVLVGETPRNELEFTQFKLRGLPQGVLSSLDILSDRQLVREGLAYAEPPPSAPAAPFARVVLSVAAVVLLLLLLLAGFVLTRPAHHLSSF